GKRLRLTQKIHLRSERPPVVTSQQVHKAGAEFGRAAQSSRQVLQMHLWTILLAGNHVRAGKHRSDVIQCLGPQSIPQGTPPWRVERQTGFNAGAARLSQLGRTLAQITLPAPE